MAFISRLKKNKMEQKTETQVGDFVRLTDPLDNGMIVRVEMVENGWIEFIGGGQSCYEQVKGSIKLFGVEHFWTLSEFIRLLEQGFGVKLYPESAIKLYRNAAEKNAEELGKSEKYWEDEHNKLINAQDELCAKEEENKKLKEELARCRAKNAAYLREKKQAENKAELLEKEVADLKVPESRQNRHLRDELHKVRLESQQAWEKATEELVNKATVESELQRVIAERDKYLNFAIELGDKNNALKQQLDVMKIVKENQKNGICQMSEEDIEKYNKRKY